MTSGTAMRDIAVAAAALAILIAVPFLVHSPAFLDYIIRIAAMSLFATSLNLLVGGTGLVSFGHGMFYGLGAYAFALLMQRTQISLAAAAGCSLVISALVGLAVGAVCIRLRAIYFAFVTLAMQMLFYSIIITWQSLTGGDQGLQGGIPRRVLFGFDLNSQFHLYTVSAVVMVVGLLLLRHVSASPLGATLRMIRDNEPRTAFLGVTVWRAKLTAFVIAGVFASLGGILAALFVSGAYPELANWPISGQAIFAVMLGGVSTFLGPLAGAAILLALGDAVTRFTEYNGMVLGLVILFVTLGLRRGVLDVLTEALRRRRTGPAAGAAE
ncbi:MAG: branched-chain amino acid ABC transporter permease [Proteobacteria bacterium]|nr:branched-chain amino acid ABC transporter permease [Pseudomonadota bacterium]